MANHTSSGGGDSRRPVTFHIQVDDYRVHKIPGIDGAKIGSCYVRADELVAQLHLDSWLSVNPRVPYRNAPTSETNTPRFAAAPSLDSISRQLF